MQSIDHEFLSICPLFAMIGALHFGVVGGHTTLVFYCQAGISVICVGEQ